MLNENQIADIWILFSEYIDKKQIEAVAERYVDLLADLGVSDQVFNATVGTDSTLDDAIEYYLDDPSEDDDDDYKELDF